MSEKLKCKICGFEGMSLTTHLKYKHSYTTGMYKEKYGECKMFIHSEELRKKISDSLKKLNEDPNFRSENSRRQKNGASCLTVKHWTNKGFSENDAVSEIRKLQISNSSKSVLKGNFDARSVFCKKYWMLKGKSESDAIEIIKQHQIKASSKSSKFKGHIRSEESRRKISHTMQEKIRLYGFANTKGTSKIEQDFYNCIKQNIDPLLQSNINIGRYIVDVIINKKIIEFYGDYWHCNPILYKSGDLVKFKKSRDWTVDYIWEKNKKRIDYLKELGYDVMIVWEYDWKKNKDECIDKIKKYLL